MDIYLFVYDYRDGMQFEAFRSLEDAKRFADEIYAEVEEEEGFIPWKGHGGDLEWWGEDDHSILITRVRVR